MTFCCRWLASCDKIFQQASRIFSPSDSSLVIENKNPLQSRRPLTTCKFLSLYLNFVFSLTHVLPRTPMDEYRTSIFQPTRANKVETTPHWPATSFNSAYRWEVVKTAFLIALPCATATAPSLSSLSSLGSLLCTQRVNECEIKNSFS